MIILSLESENGAILTYRLGKPQITVGSSSRNDVVIKSPGVVDRHLVIARSGEVFTFVGVDRQTVVLNGERRSRGVLNPGDRLRIGGATLVFRSGNTSAAELEDPQPQQKVQFPVVMAAQREGGEPVIFRADPAGYPKERARLAELFREPTFDSLKQLVAVLKEAVPGIEIALMEITDSGETVALASVWSGELPKVPSQVLDELKVPGRVAVVANGRVSSVLIGVLELDGTVPALLALRPAGSLPEEGIALMSEAARFVGAAWHHIGRRWSPGAGWESDAAARLDALLPGTSQAMQVLRAGALVASYGNEAVLICGANGVGRTQVARIVASLAPGGPREVVLVEGTLGDGEKVRRELFGPSGHPSFGPDAQGAVARARGNVLVLRNADALPASLQSELAALISAQQREPFTTSSTRFMITCGEDPLALVQQGKLAMPLFLVFSQRMLRVPRLTERREDLPRLIASMIRTVATEQQKVVRGISLECLNALLAHSYTGEMAELVLELNRLVTATPDGEMVRSEYLLESSAAPADTPGSASEADTSGILSSDDLKVVVERVERLLIDRVMRRVKGNQSKGARTLGISRGALIAKVKEYSIPDYRFLRRRKK
jgi:DNA-binding NtrC family response regulator